jgi:SulP family sulfate permease
MCYANSQQLSEEIVSLVNTAAPQVRLICLDASAVDDVDYSAAETLRSIHNTLEGKKKRLVVAQVLDDVKAESRCQLSQLFGEDAFYDTLEDVVKDFRQQTGTMTTGKDSGPGRRPAE